MAVNNYAFYCDLFTRFGNPVLTGFSWKYFVGFWVREIPRALFDLLVEGVDSLRCQGMIEHKYKQ